MTDSFYDILPVYLSMGMPENVFWECSPREYAAYRKAYNYRKQSQNEDMYVMGAYVFNALMPALANALSAFSKGKHESAKYLKKPFDLYQTRTKEEQEAYEAEKDKRDSDAIRQIFDGLIARSKGKDK